MTAIAALCGACAVGALVPSARAQAVADAGALAVGTAFFKAIEAADWKAAASFLDLEVLDEMRRTQADGARRQRPSTAEDYMRADTALPRVVAEYYAKRLASAARSHGFLEQEFGVADPDSLLALPIDIVAQRWLEVHDERWMTRQALRSSGCSSAFADTATIPTSVQQVLGAIVRDSIAYLLHRPEHEGLSLKSPYASPPLIMVLRRRRDNWWVLPSTQMFGMMGISIHCERKKQER